MPKHKTELDLSHLNFLIMYNRYPEFKKALQNYDGTIQDMSSLLIAAVSRENTEFTAWLLLQGADVNVRVRSQYADTISTPLATACKKQQPHQVRLLLKHGADPNALSGSEHNGPFSPLVYAIQVKNQEILRLLLADPRTNVNQQLVFGSTALHFAVAQNNTDAVRRLLEAGADVLQKNNDGKTPLDQAFEKKKGNKEIQHMLKRAFQKYVLHVLAFIKNPDERQDYRRRFLHQSKTVLPAKEQRYWHRLSDLLAPLRQRLFPVSQTRKRVIQQQIPFLSADLRRQLEQFL